MYSKCFFTLTIILFVLSCSNENNTFRGNHIELDFFNAEGIEDQDWIEIDGIQFIHHADFQGAQQNLFSLPASKFVFNDTTTNRQYTSPGGSISLAIQLGNYIDLINQTDSMSVKFKNGVYVSHIPLMMTHGKLRLKSTNGSRFTIKTSDGYSVPVSIIE